MKKNIYTLDTDDQPIDDIAYLLFHNTDPGYIFADSINHLYDLHLCRTDDLPLLQQQWPFYTYADTLGQLHYYLVERPAAAPASATWGPSEKLLIIKGDCAPEQAQLIYEDFSDPVTPSPDDLLAHSHAAIRDEMIAGLTVVNILDLSAPPLENANTKAARDRNTLQRLCNSILEYIESNSLDLPSHS